jgi:hypothetical protein
MAISLGIYPIFRQTHLGLEFAAFTTWWTQYFGETPDWSIARKFEKVVPHNLHFISKLGHRQWTVKWHDFLRLYARNATFLSGWWFGTMEFYDFPFSWEWHHPNWLSLIFFRGVGQPPTSSGLFFGRIQRIFQTKFVVWAISKKLLRTFGSQFFS